MYISKVAYLAVAELPEKFDDCIAYSVYTGEGGEYFEVELGNLTNKIHIISKFLELDLLLESEAEDLLDASTLMIWVSE